MQRSGELLRVDIQEIVIAFLGPTNVSLFGDNPSTTNEIEAFPVGKAVVVYSGKLGFFDDIQYTVQISAPEPLEVTLNHRPLNLIWVRHGSLYMANTAMRFSQVGWAEFRVGDDGVRIRIQSRKMDYQSDYRTMIWDLENHVRGLTAQLVSAVVEGMERTADVPMDLWSYWLSVLQVIWEQLARDLTHAWITLPIQMTFEQRRMHIERLKKVTGREFSMYVRTNDPQISTFHLTWTSLSVERLYLLQLLQYIRQRLERVLSQVPKLADHRRLSIILQQVVRLLRRLSTAAGVERVFGEPRIPESPLAQSHPALRRVVYWHRLLQSGLFPNDDRYFVGVKDLNLLYEYWCFLAIVRMVLEESGGMLRVHPVVSADPIDILLSSGRNHAAQVELPNGQYVSILYERQFSGLPTVAQKPDHVVELRGLGSLLVFDAKYRFEVDDDYITQYGKGDPIPPIDTINEMHRYHDAIVLSHVPYSRIVERAIVLFPLPSQFFARWREHRFYKSIDAVGVGALPLLPGGDDTYVRTEIRRYLKLE